MNLCVTLFIYQESLRDARLTKCKKCKTICYAAFQSLLSAPNTFSNENSFPFNLDFLFSHSVLLRSLGTRKKTRSFKPHAYPTLAQKRGNIS